MTVGGYVVVGGDDAVVLAVADAVDVVCICVGAAFPSVRRSPSGKRRRQAGSLSRGNHRGEQERQALRGPPEDRGHHRRGE